jgi:hypothetical protein
MCTCNQEFIGVFEKKAGQKQESKHREERGNDRRDDRRGDDYRDSRGGSGRDDYRDSRGGSARGRSRSPPRDQKSIEEQIREREREKALAVGGRCQRVPVSCLVSTCFTGGQELREQAANIIQDCAYDNDEHGHDAPPLALSFPSS